MDSKTWFSRGQASIRDEIEHWIGKAARCIPLQESIHRELVAFHNQSPLPASSEEEHRISRRVAIATLAVLPSYLSSPPQQGKKVLLDVEAFLPHCAASVTACWHLLQGGGLATIAYTIPQFLHTLETLAQQSSVYQKAAAHLASQGCLLMGIVAAHRLQFALRETLCTHAVKYSKIADDQVLQVAALAALGEAFLYTNKHDEMLLKCQEALNAVRGLAEPLHPLMRSKALAELARAYALNGKQDEAKHCIDEAYALHSEKLAETPVFLSTDSGIHLLISRKGRTLLELHQRYPKEGYAQDAENALAEIDQHAAITTIPEPWRVGIMRQQAKAALYQGNLSDFQRYLQKSIEGAIALNSSKLRQDAVELYQEVRRPGHKWRNEGAIKDLGDLLV